MLAEKKIEISELGKEKIVFKSTYSWAFCLNADCEEKQRYYSLIANDLNYQKLQKLIPNLESSKITLKLSSNPINKSLSRLRNYQLADVNFLSKLRNIGIFSEMRTGKTPIALMTFGKLPVTNLLIISPSILQQQWQKAVEDWLSRPAYIITFLEKEWRYEFYRKILSEEGWIIIVSKDTFKTDSSQFKKLKNKKGTKNNYCVIIDEAHFLRNHQSQQSKSAYLLKDAQYKMVLTGTPVVNHHTDIFGILKFLQPDTYSSYWKFAEEYFYVRKLEFKKGKNKFLIRQVKNFKNEWKKQILQKEVSQFSVNRRQRDVLPWLPLIIYQKEYLLMEEQQQDVYSQWKEKWKSEYQPLEVLAKLKTLTLYPPALGFEQSLGIKINYLANFLQERKEQSMIIFSTRSETFLAPLSRILKTLKMPTGLIIGQTSYQEKEKYIQQFQNNELKILLCNLQTAGVGLNLSRAETIIFADRSYSPADNEQAEARFLPTNSEETPRVRLVIDLICKGTIDEKILDLLKRKEDIIKVLNSNPGYFFT
jgi:SNF2 family DNA or RNA helicase